MLHKDPRRLATALTTQRSREGLAAHLWEQIVATWRNSGRELVGLTRADTAALDEFHAGGRAATLALARLAGLGPE